MPIDKVKVVEAKFKRDGKNLTKTFLINGLNGHPAELLNACLNKFEKLSDERMIIFYSDFKDCWFVISDKRIISFRNNRVEIVKFEDILSVNSLINEDDLISLKRNGLKFLKLNLIHGVRYELKIEERSFSIIDGIISYLLWNR